MNIKFATLFVLAFSIPSAQLEAISFTTILRAFKGGGATKSVVKPQVSRAALLKQVQEELNANLKGDRLSRHDL